MHRISKFRAVIQDLSLIEILLMSRNSEKVYYAVGRGKKLGIYDSWVECKAQTEGIANAKFRKFYSHKEAEEFVNFWRNYSSPVKQHFECENLVSKVSHWKRNAVSRRNQYSADKKKFRSINISHFHKNKNNSILGKPNGKEDYKNESALSVTPYISPLPSAGLNFISLKTNLSNKKPTNSFEIAKSKNISTQDNSNILNQCCYLDINSSKLRNKRLQTGSKINSQEHSKYSSSKPSAPSTDALSDSKLFMLQNQNSALQSDTFNKKKPSESCLDTFEEDACIIKEEVVDVESNGQIEKVKQSENFESTGTITEINNKLTSCVTMFESALNEILKLNINKSGRLNNSLKTLLERLFNHINTNIHPQMEQESADKIHEDGKNCEAQQAAVIEPTCHHQPFSQMSCSHSQSLSSHSISFEGNTDQKNIDVLALNLRIDSFEKRFDALLKEIGGITSEISQLKTEIKELKEYSSDGSHFGSFYSPKKDKDGMLQTTLNFGSNFQNTSPFLSHSAKRRNADSRNSVETTLKRKLSSSDSSESSKRFADDGRVIDDLLSKIKTEAVDYTSFTVDEDDFVEVYTDGAAQFNGLKNAKAGIGVWFGEKHPMNVAEPVVGNPTNNVAEIQAARVAIELAIKAGITKLKIFTDSEFLINCATKWIDRWKKNGWILSKGGPVKNRRDLEKLDKAASKINVRWEKVPGHAGIRGNETADRLANEGALKYNT